MKVWAVGYEPNLRCEVGCMDPYGAVTTVATGGVRIAVSRIGKKKGDGPIMIGYGIKDRYA